MSQSEGTRRNTLHTHFYQPTSQVLYYTLFHGIYSPPTSTVFKPTYPFFFIIQSHLPSHSISIFLTPTYLLFHFSLLLYIFLPPSHFSPTSVSLLGCPHIRSLTRPPYLDPSSTSFLGCSFFVTPSLLNHYFLIGPLYSVSHPIPCLITFSLLYSLPSSIIHIHP